MLADRYELRDLIGRGGMGLVWAAHDTVLHRGVAVKEVTFPQSVTADERALLCERTFREARAAARVHHPHATTVHDVVEADGKPWIVMQYAPGRPLSDIVRSDGPLPLAAVARIGIDILDALRAAHRAGVLHRDVKPANVLVGDDGSACLTDFGIAMSSGDPSITTEGILLGSPSYMSPERARGDDLTAASDLWSLGATLYFAVEGRPAFDGGGAMATLVAVSVADPAPMRRAGPLEPILLSLLEKAPDRRPAADELRAALRDVLERAPGDVVPLAASPVMAPAATAAEPPDDRGGAADRVERLDFGQLAQLAAQTATVTGGLAASAARRAVKKANRRRVRHWVRVSLLVVVGIAVVLATALGVAVYEIVTHL
jgi:serine/threonine protein kinase